MVRERNEFNNSFYEIQKAETVEKETNNLFKIGKGTDYFGEKCGSCGNKFGIEDVIGAPCGHMFHSECGITGWCPICRSSFETKIVEEIQKTEAYVKMRLEIFDREDEISLSSNQNLEEKRPLPQPDGSIIFN